MHLGNGISSDSIIRSDHSNCGDTVMSLLIFIIFILGVLYLMNKYATDE